MTWIDNWLNGSELEVRVTDIEDTLEDVEGINIGKLETEVSELRTALSQFSKLSSKQHEEQANQLATLQKLVEDIVIDNLEQDERLDQLESKPVDPVDPPVITPVPEPSTGFFSGKPHSEAKVFYLDADNGSDSNPGTKAKPFKTIAEAMRHVIDGRGDWLRLRGDVPYSYNQVRLRGRSKEFPAVLTNWEGEDRAVVRGMYLSPRINQTAKHAVITQLDFAPTVNPGIAYATGSGLVLLNSHEDVLIEDCVFRHGDFGVRVQGYEGRCKNITVRRNIIAENYTGGGHSSGMFVDKADGVTIEENLFYRNGWHPSDPTKFGRTIFNHNLYVQHECTGIAIRGNISTEGASYGMFSRSGGEMSYNLFYREPMGCAMNGYEERSKDASNVFRNLIVNGIHMEHIRSNRDPNRGWGIQIFPSVNGHYCENMVLDLATDGRNANGIVGEGDGGFNTTDADPHMVIENNIVRRWKNRNGNPSIDPRLTADDSRWTWRNNRVIDSGPTLDELLRRMLVVQTQDIIVWHRNRNIGEWDDRMKAQAVCNAMWEELKDQLAIEVVY